MFIGGKHLHNTFKPMTNNELTLDQLRSVSGGDSNTNWKKSTYNLKELSNSGSLVPFKVVIPDPMYFPSY